MRIALLVLTIFHLPHLILQGLKHVGQLKPVRAIKISLDLVIFVLHIITLVHLWTFKGNTACLPSRMRDTAYYTGSEQIVDGQQIYMQKLSILLLVSGTRVFLAVFQHLEKTLTALLSFLIMLLVLAACVGLVLHHQYGSLTEAFSSWRKALLWVYLAFIGDIELDPLIHTQPVLGVCIFLFTYLLVAVILFSFVVEILVD
ncbi:hypothetical protein Pcinc_015288 [Petrolisthes cinctipes]|uniref:Ion transport domain-containing protein n=1 Tax=Petrolisthes cinctipes TaxID=88211 RepID=A0AAE1FTM4_PETCI|nr:hypothetical protein Pcinc_015288 [Petrolisthes cinctipes]